MSAITSVTSPVLPPTASPPDHGPHEKMEASEQPEIKEPDHAQGSRLQSDIDTIHGVAAKSQIAANAEATHPVNDTDAQPARLALDTTQTMEAAREQYLRGVKNLNDVDRNGEKLNRRVPLIDEMPDRPMPGFPDT